MFCPETYRLNTRLLTVIHHGDGDVEWHHRPRAERWNPLRYEAGLIAKYRGGYVMRINRGGRWNLHVSNAIWRIKRLGA